MDNPADRSPTPKPRRARLLKTSALVLTVMFVAVIALVVRTKLSSENIVWLTPDEMARAVRQTPLTRLKEKIIHASAFLWQGFRRPPSNVNVSTLVLALPASEETFQLGTPEQTHERGLRAWILSAAEYEVMRRQIDRLPAYRTESSAGVSTVSGGWTSVQSGKSVNIQGSSQVAGYQATIRARAVRGSWNLTCSMTVTEPIRSGNGSATGLRTNLAFACQVTITNQGALVIQNPTSAVNGTNYWLIVSPTAIAPRPSSPPKKQPAKALGYVQGQ